MTKNRFSILTGFAALGVGALMLASPITEAKSKRSPTKSTKVSASFGDDAKETTQVAMVKSGKKKHQLKHSDRKSKLDPAPLSKATLRGLDWLVEHQLENGGWGQGEESRGMGRNERMASQANVADSSMALLALFRSGSTTSSGPYRKAIKKGVDYVMKEIEASDKNDMYVSKTRGTRVQGKIGPYVDTFLSAQLLSELKGTMESQKAERRLTVALNKVLSKIENNQQDDGTWNKAGWAPALSQAVASKAFNRATKKGIKIDDKVRERAEKYAKKNFDGKKFGTEGTAGVALYGAASTAGSLADNDEANEYDERALKEQVKSKDRGIREQAQRKLDRAAETRAARDGAQRALVGRLNDPSFVAGFGNNGGEEFLSYIFVSESLAQDGGKEWVKWNKSMMANLTRVQNGDGSWTGHHCITGRTFCTAAALLVMMADRSQIGLSITG